LELFKLFGTIAINNQEANEDIDETTGKASHAESKIVESFKKVGTAVATFFAVEKIVSFGKACIDAASDASAMESQFTQVFGDLEGEASASLAGIASQAGITENRMKSSYTKIAAFAKTTGMETADALSIADRAMVAVADSAAFYDRSLEETTESLQSFLKGNFENDAALGLSCTETTRNAAANALYGKSFKDLSESQKQLTLLQMVEDANALSGALGQASRESDTWTNQTGNLQQAWTDFKSTIGENFLDFAVAGVTKVTEVVQACSEKVPVLISWFQSVYDSVSVYFPMIQEVFQNAWSVAQTIWQSVGQPIFNMIQQCVMTVATIFSQKMPEIEAFVQTCFQDIQVFWDENLKPCFDAIGAFIQDVLAPTFQVVFGTYIKSAVDAAFLGIKNLWETSLKPVLTGITDFLTGVFTLNFTQAFQGIVNAVGGIFSGLGAVIKAPLNTVIGILNQFIDYVNTLQVPSWVPRYGGMGINLSHIPLLEQGGVLERGQVGLLEGNGAEAVVPLDQNKKWISAVADDMNGAIGGDSEHTQRIIALLEQLVDTLPEVMVDAFTAMKFDVNNREFARLVKAVN
jgi:hypothetical protein